MTHAPRAPWLTSTIDRIELAFGRSVAAPLFRLVDRLAPGALAAASWEPDTHAGASFVRDAALWRRQLFLLKMLGSLGLDRAESVDALRGRLADREAPPPTADGPEIVFLGDLLAVDGLGRETLTPALRARLARADRLVINLEATIGAATHAIAPLFTGRGLGQLVQWNRSQDGASWSSRLGREDLDALLDGLPPVTFSVANNHAFDDGPEGFARTLAALDAMGASAAGVTDGEREGGVVIEVGPRTVGLLGIGFGSNRPEGAEGRTLAFAGVPYRLPTPRIRREIARLRDAGATYLAALLHWGYEHEHLPREDQVACVEELWSLGVDAVIGHHPHLVQPCAGSGRRLAAFSLGDFVGGDRTVWSRLGLAVAVRLPPPGSEASPAVSAIPLIQTPHHAAHARTGLLEEATGEERALWDALHRAKVEGIGDHGGDTGTSRPSSSRSRRSAAP